VSTDGAPAPDQHWTQPQVVKRIAKLYPAAGRDAFRDAGQAEFLAENVEQGQEGLAL
jgi:hypothetical protein